jgi:hypothetical protein
MKPLPALHYSTYTPETAYRQAFQRNIRLYLTWQNKIYYYAQSIHNL